MSNTNDKRTRRDFVAATAAAVAGVGLLTSPVASWADAPAPLRLPEPKLDGRFSVEAALQKRRSVRGYASSPLTLSDIGQLCWAAQGQTDPESFKRTAPSAHGVYPLELYVAAGMVTGLATGFYHYSPDSHALELVAPRDMRPDLDRVVMQTWNHIATAPAVFVLSGNLSKMTGSEDLLVKARPSEFMWAEAGCAAQGFFLQAGARGLGSTFIGGFNPKQALEVLGLNPAEEVLVMLPVGKRI
jgi:SagB-type dehydrogenase family enzyme